MQVSIFTSSRLDQLLNWCDSQSSVTCWHFLLYFGIHVAVCGIMDLHHCMRASVFVNMYRPELKNERYIALPKIVRLHPFRGKRFTIVQVCIRLAVSRQVKAEYAAKNPMKEVPAIQIDGHLLTQSLVYYIPRRYKCTCFRIVLAHPHRQLRSCQYAHREH